MELCTQKTAEVVDSVKTCQNLHAYLDKVVAVHKSNKAADCTGSYGTPCTNSTIVHQA